MDSAEADGRTGLSALLSGRGRRPILLIGAVAAVICTLAALRETAPPEPVQHSAASNPGTEPPRVRFTPSPSAEPRGTLPAPDVVNPGQNRVSGNVPEAGTEPNEQTAFNGVNQILNWYCPESTALDSSIEQVQGWDTVKVIARPRSGTEIALSLTWTGAFYRWQGPLDELERCW